MSQNPRPPTLWDVVELLVEIDRRLHSVQRQLDVVINQGNANMANLDDLQAKVDAEGTVVDSVVALIQGLRTEIAAAGTDPVKLQAIISSLDSQTSKLAAAVANSSDVTKAPAAAPPTDPTAPTV